MQSEKTPHNFHIFYGWYILAASFLILFFTTGARFTIGVVFKPLMAEFGWDRGLISLAFFLNMTVFAFSLIFIGRAYDRYGPKWVIMISGVFLSAGFMSLAFVETPWQFFIFYGILAALGMGGNDDPSVRSTNEQMVRKGSRPRSEPRAHRQLHRPVRSGPGFCGTCSAIWVENVILLYRYDYAVGYYRACLNGN